MSKQAARLNDASFTSHRPAHLAIMQFLLVKIERAIEHYSGNWRICQSNVCERWPKHHRRSKF